MESEIPCPLPLSGCSFGVLGLLLASWSNRWRSQLDIFISNSHVYWFCHSLPPLGPTHQQVGISWQLCFTLHQCPRHIAEHHAKSNTTLLQYINQLVVEDLCTPVMLGAMLLGAKPPVVSHRNLFETKNNSHTRTSSCKTCLGEEITGLCPCCQFCVQWEQDMLSCGPATYKAKHIDLVCCQLGGR